VLRRFGRCRSPILPKPPGLQPLRPFPLVAGTRQGPLHRFSWPRHCLLSAAAVLKSTLAKPRSSSCLQSSVAMPQTGLGPALEGSAPEQSGALLPSVRVQFLTGGSSHRIAFHFKTGVGIDTSERDRREHLRGFRLLDTGVGGRVSFSAAYNHITARLVAGSTRKTFYLTLFVCLQIPAAEEENS